MVPIVSKSCDRWHGYCGSLRPAPYRMTSRSCSWRLSWSQSHRMCRFNAYTRRYVQTPGRKTRSLTHRAITSFSFHNSLLSCKYTFLSGALQSFVNHFFIILYIGQRLARELEAKGYEVKAWNLYKPNGGNLKRDQVATKCDRKSNRHYLEYRGVGDFDHRPFIKTIY